MAMRYVIVGAGPAGVVAAETVRRRDATGEITLIGDEPGEPYARMAIPYVLTGKIGEAGALLRKTKDHYRSLGIRYVPGRAAKLDSAKKELKFHSAWAHRLRSKRCAQRILGE